MISARFNPKNLKMEQKFRHICSILRERDLKILMVEAGLGQCFGEKTMAYLNQLHEHNGIMLAVCTKD